MPYCTNCGHDIDAEAKFCPACGFSRKPQEPQSRQEHQPQHQSFAENDPYETLRNVIIAIIGLMGLGEIINLMNFDIFSLVITGIIIGIVYFFGLKKLEVRDYKTVEILLVATASLTTSLFVRYILTSNTLFALIDFAISSLCLYGWNEIYKWRKQKEDI